MPCPATASNPLAGGTLRPRSSAAASTAVASGCSLPRSAAATSRSSPSSSRSPAPSNSTTSVTLGLPSVMVPVLSSTTVSSLCAVSSALPSRMSTPFSAPLPVPTMMAVGVARPRAQGHAMTSTATKLSSA